MNQKLSNLYYTFHNTSALEQKLAMSRVERG